MAESELKKIQKEINKLKKHKEKKLALAKSYQEKEQLLREIQQLEAIKQSPSAMKSFAGTFGRGLKITGSWLWKKIQAGSRNLEKNDMELQRIAQKKQTYRQPYSDLGMMYLPSERPRPVKMPKQKKGKMKKLKVKKLKFGRGTSDPLTWDLP